MRQVTFVNKCVTSLLILLTVCNPMTQAAASTAMPVARNTQSDVANGKLANGLSYTVVSNDNSTQDEVMVRLSVRTNGNAGSPEDIGISLLTQQALFYGTYKYKRERIIQFLNSLDFDIDGQGHLKSTGKDAIIQFSLDADRKGELYGLLGFLKELTQSATLTDEGIEIARQNTLAMLKEQLGFMSKEDVTTQISVIADIEGLTAYQIREYYLKWYRPDLMHLFVSGNVSIERVEQYIQDAFEAQTLPAPEQVDVRLATNDHREMQKSLQAAADENFFDRVTATPTPAIKELSTAPSKVDGEQVIVIDGKIWMNDPNWINKSENGWFLSKGLAAAGVLAAAVSVLPLTFVCWVAAAYFYWTPYLKDPQYVQEKRAEDLRLGFEQACLKGRAHITLTPFERRQKFLTETVNRQVGANNYKASSIALLADRYDLAHETFTAMFCKEEIIALAQVRKDFVRTRNEWKAALNAVENELTQHTKPLRKDRDDALEKERTAYETSYYVALRAEWKKTRDEAIERYLADKKAGVISQKDYNFAVQEEERKFDVLTNEPTFVMNYENSKEYYNARVKEINSIYESHIAKVKHDMRYDERIHYFKDGEKSVYDYYDTQYMQVLAQFAYVNYAVADWIDLRTSR